MAVAVVNREILDGFRFIGDAVCQDNGELYNLATAMSATMGLPKPKAVVVIKIMEIHSLKPGPLAGKKIG